MIWFSILALSVSFSFHRMGPSFERGRYGIPLGALGLLCLVIFPEDLSERESEIHDSIIQFINWFTPFIFGSLLILRYSPTYFDGLPIGVLSGWILVVFSWIMIFNERDSFTFLDMITGSLVLLGFLIVMFCIIFSKFLFYLPSGSKNESEPLSTEEQDLISAILKSRLEGGKNDN